MLATSDNSDAIVDAIRGLLHREYDLSILPLYLKQLNHPDVDVRSEALEALDGYTAYLTTDVLRPVLRDMDVDIRFNAVQADRRY